MTSIVPSFAKNFFSVQSANIHFDKAALSMDLLEIGKKKYIDLRLLLVSNADVQLPGYIRLARHRSKIAC